MSKIISKGLSCTNMLFFIPRLAQKDKHLTELQAELVGLRESVELHRKKNNVSDVESWCSVVPLSTLAFQCACKAGDRILDGGIGAGQS